MLFKYESSHLKAIVGVEYHTFIFDKFYVKMLCYDMKKFTILYAF